MSLAPKPPTIPASGNFHDLYVDTAQISDLVAVSLPLENNKILVGDSSNIASPVDMSGDVTIVNTGVTTLANTAVTPGSYTNTNLTVDSKGRITSASNGSSITPSALTRVNDTNVTLTLGGSPNTALLQATSITAGWSGQLGLTRGGTNNSLTASNGGIVWSDNEKLNILSGTVTEGQVLVSGTSSTPSWSTSLNATNSELTMLTDGLANLNITSTNLGFFGNNAARQVTDGTLESIVSILKSYGLCIGFQQQGSKLVGTGYTGAANQGNKISLSTDGNTLAVSGRTDDSLNGATWIFTRSGTTWSQQGDKLVGTGNTGAADQGYSLSISSDGNTLAIGARGDNSSQGAVWIFTRSGTTWSQEGDKLVGTGNIGASFQGQSVSLSGDGNTLAIGGPVDNTQQGAVWIFTRSGTVWSQQGSKLIGTGNTGTAAQGQSVSLSEDGNILAIGGYDDNSSIGATWIFTRSGTTWSQQGSKLVGSGYTGSIIFQGNSVSLSSNGDILAISGTSDNGTVGATWIFTRTGTTWSQQGSKLVGSGYIGDPFQGTSISLSPNGNMLAIGSSEDDFAVGATWIFIRSGTTWSQLGNKIVGTGNTGAAAQGQSVSLSLNGTVLAIGGYGDDGGIGATWIFG